MFRRLAGQVFLLSLVLALMVLNHAGDELPSRVASHYGADGTADGWMDRDAFVRLFALLVGGLSALWLVWAWLAPRLPAAALNLSHRDFWLAPERRAVTVRRFRDLMLAIGAVTNLFFCGLLQLTVVANRLPEPRLSAWFWVLTVVYLGFVAGWVVWWLRTWRANDEIGTISHQRSGRDRK